MLLSGNHGAIAAWRHEQRLARTAARRPDLLHASHGATGTDVEHPRRDAGRRARARRAHARRAGCRRRVANDTLDIPALHESLDDVRASLDTTQTWVARSGGRLVGAVRTSAVAPG